MKKLELIEEIKSICVGAFSPDALKNGQQDPLKELLNCYQDLQRISDIAEELERLTTNQTKVKI